MTCIKLLGTAARSTAQPYRCGIAVVCSAAHVKACSTRANHAAAEPVDQPRRKRAYVDTAFIHVCGGTGGMGGASYGGVGGDGGSVVIEAQPSSTLPGPGMSRKYLAETGGASSRNKGRRGKAAPDLVVKVPLGTCIFDENNARMADLDATGHRVVVAQGGKGGSMFTTDYCPTKGERRAVRLEVKTIADVGLVGFPNAGKSTLLRALSNAVPKVANYPFTTLRPHLGIVHYPDHSQITMADIPGLVEGAHANLGMGHKFLRHIERTKALLYVIDLHGFRLSDRDPFRSAFECFQLLQSELEHYDHSLAQRPSLVVLNKTDVPDAEERVREFQEAMADVAQGSLANVQGVHHISAATGVGVDDVKDSLKRLVH